MPEGPNTRASPDRPALRMLAACLGYGLILVLILASARFDSGHTAPKSEASRTEPAGPRQPLVQMSDVLRQGYRARMPHARGQPNQSLVRC
jgi:hypothetical protein